nr:hypothetical protein [Trichoderma harzianum]
MQLNIASVASFLVVQAFLAGATSITYCTTGSCQTNSNAADGQCYNIPSNMNDAIWSVDIKGGNCVFWDNYNCQHIHTNQITGSEDAAAFCKDGSGQHTATNDNCLWNTMISSYKCCTSGWCAGSTPKCNAYDLAAC